MRIACPARILGGVDRRRAMVLSRVLAAALLACASAAALASRPEVRAWAIARSHPEVGWISRDELAARLASSEPPVVLDARTEAEVAVSTIEGALRVDPIAPALELVPRDRDVVVYCSIGVRSAEVVERLRAAGHARVWSLEGGIFEWANEGRPLFRGAERASVVHLFDATWGLLLRAERRARPH